jgi:hypothetical protein
MCSGAFTFQKGLVNLSRGDLFWPSTAAKHTCAFAGINDLRTPSFPTGIAIAAGARSVKVRLIAEHGDFLWTSN